LYNELNINLKVRSGWPRCRARKPDEHDAAFTHRVLDHRRTPIEQLAALDPRSVGKG
jgi:hypothetical protein